MVPEIKFRIPAKINGGIVSTPIRIPKKVVPQKNATQNNARYSFVFKQQACYTLSFPLVRFLQHGLHQHRHKPFRDARHKKLGKLTIVMHKLIFSFYFF